jgi:DnaK suppressor protein
MALQKNLAAAAQDHKRMVLLTETQIVQMDKAQYMSEAQKQFFRARLGAIEEMLRARAHASAAEIATCEAGADPVDRASAEEEHQLAIKARARDAEQLIEVRAALARIDADEFGWCVETGEMIGLGRLLICPTTTMCVEAQQRRETRAARYRI